MYTNQQLQVRWGNETSGQFNVLHGVKQGGVLWPILFAIYMDGLLDRLAETGVGCHMEYILLKYWPLLTIISYSL